MSGFLAFLLSLVLCCFRWLSSFSLWCCALKHLLANICSPTLQTNSCFSAATCLEGLPTSALRVRGAEHMDVWVTSRFIVWQMGLLEKTTGVARGRWWHLLVPGKHAVCLLTYNILTPQGGAGNVVGAEDTFRRSFPPFPIYRDG